MSMWVAVGDKFHVKENIFCRAQLTAEITNLNEKLLSIFAQYNLVLKSLSVRGSHSVAHNKTHAENVASKESQKSKFTNSSTKIC